MLPIFANLVSFICLNLLLVVSNDLLSLDLFQPVKVRFLIRLSLVRCENELNISIDDILVQLWNLDVSIHGVVVSSSQEEVSVRLGVMLLEFGITGQQLIQVIILEVAHVLHDDLVTGIVYIQLFLVFKHILQLISVFGVQPILLDTVNSEKSLTLSRRHHLSMTVPLRLDESNTSDLLYLVHFLLSNFSELFSHILLFLIEILLLLIVDGFSTKDLLLLVLRLVALLFGKCVHSIVT